MQTSKIGRDTQARRRSIAFWSIFYAISLMMILGHALLLDKLVGDKIQQQTSLAHAKATAELVFQSLYSIMEEGGDVSTLHGAIMRMESVEHTRRIHLVRSKSIVSEFGDLKENARLKSQRPEIQGALDTGQRQHTVAPEGGSYVFPARYGNRCLTCHTHGKVGEVAGAVVVDYSLQASHNQTNLVIAISSLYALTAMFLLGLMFRQRNR